MGCRHHRESGGPTWATVRPCRRWMPAFAQGCPGKIFRRRRERTRLSNFVLAGLGPAIHALARSKERRRCADQVRARRLKIVAASPTQVVIAANFFPDSPALS